MKRTIKQAFYEYHQKGCAVSDPATLEFNGRGLLLQDIMNAYLEGDVSQEEFLSFRDQAYHLFSERYQVLMDF